MRASQPTSTQPSRHARRAASATPGLRLPSSSAAPGSAKRPHTSSGKPAFNPVARSIEEILVQRTAATAMASLAPKSGPKAQPQPQLLRLSQLAPEASLTRAMSAPGLAARSRAQMQIARPVSSATARTMHRTLVSHRPLESDMMGGRGQLPPSPGSAHGEWGRGGSQRELIQAYVGGGGGEDPRAIELRESVERLASQLQRMEGLTSLLHADYTASLQGKLSRSFDHIAEHVAELDGTFLSEQQKRQHVAALRLVAACRGFLVRQNYRRARASLHSWRSRELMPAQLVAVSWLRRREDLEARTGAILEYRAEVLLARIVQAWRQLTAEALPARKELDSCIAAMRHCRRSLARRALVGWRRVAHMAKQADIKWVTRGGRRVAMRSAHVELMHSHLRAWRRLTRTRRETERRFRSTGASLVGAVFRGWRGASRRQAQLRLVAVQRWIEFGRVYGQLPFRAWYLFVVDAKTARKVRGALLAAFRRRLGRALLARLLGAWRDLSQHRPVETRSRPQLVRALHAQEQSTLAAEENMREYARVLHEAEQALLREEAAKEAMALEAARHTQQMIDAMFELHAAQHECLRLRAALRAYELRYPRAFLAPGESADGLPETPLVATRNELDALLRLRALTGWMGEAQRYVPLPRAKGAAADEELAKVRQLLHYVASGALPPDAPEELQRVVAGHADSVARRTAAAEASVLTDDLETARPLRSEAALRTEPPERPPAATDEGVADFFGAERAPPAELLGGAGGGGGGADASSVSVTNRNKISFADFEAETDAMFERADGVRAGAAQLSARVRERREELQRREKTRRINIYMAGDQDDVGVDGFDSSLAAAIFSL